jgi:hypothetical protein
VARVLVDSVGLRCCFHPDVPLDVKVPTMETSAPFQVQVLMTDMEAALLDPRTIVFSPLEVVMPHVGQVDSEVWDLEIFVKGEVSYRNSYRCHFFLIYETVKLNQIELSNQSITAKVKKDLKLSLNMIQFEPS